MTVKELHQRIPGAFVHRSLAMSPDASGILVALAVIAEELCEIEALLRRAYGTVGEPQ